MTTLLRYDAACRALAEAKSFDEVREWEDKAAAVREYSRRARNRTLELDALEIRERARLRRGQLLLELRESGELADGRKKQSSADDCSSVTLESKQSPVQGPRFLRTDFRAERMCSGVPAWTGPIPARTREFPDWATSREIFVDGDQIKPCRIPSATACTRFLTPSRCCTSRITLLMVRSE